MRTSLLYVFFITSTLALLPSWALAATSWRLRHGRWMWVSPGEYARYAYGTKDWVLVFVNNVLWICIICAGTIINYVLRSNT
jgi:hypothetical protein